MEPSRETKLRGCRAVWKIRLAFSMPTVLSVGECRISSGRRRLRIFSCRSAARTSSTKARFSVSALPPTIQVALPSASTVSTTASYWISAWTGSIGAPTVTTARTPGESRAAASTAAPPKECPMRMSAGVPRSAMNVHAAITSFAFTVNDPSPQSPSESPSPRASNRIIAMPSLANCLHMRAAAGQSLPSVNPWEKTPQPRMAPSGRSMTPVRVGPVQLGNVTRSAMREVYHLCAKGAGRGLPWSYEATT
ncbi:Uncharacterised protein [Mycobacteroides abscessus subsp. abscessus]|nr:Uncharacterised protein [Mycobacteroides abscessus subsp. abscessus]